MGEVNTPNFKDFSCQTLGIWDMERCQGVPTIHLDFSFSSHSHHLLTKPFPRKITIVWHSPSVPTEVSPLSQRNLPNKLQQTCCAIFPQPIWMFGFYFSLFPVKNHSQKCGFKRMSVSLPAPHLIFLPLCFPSSALWCLCLMLCWTKPTNPAHSVCSQNWHKMTQHWELFFSLNIWLAFCSLPEENDTSSVRMKWPNVTEPITALAFPRCNHRISALNRTHCSLHSCWASFLWFMPLQFQHLLYIHPSVMLQLCRASKLCGF